MMTHISVKDHLDLRRRSSLPDGTEITSATATKNGDLVLTIRTPDKQKDNTIDTSKFTLDSRNLDRLRARDPFLYYSIQNDMRSRTISGEMNVGRAKSCIVDPFASSHVESNLVTEASRRASMPSIRTQKTNQRRARPNVVKRQRRFSTETHPSLMYECMMAEHSGLNFEGLGITPNNLEEEEMRF